MVSRDTRVHLTVVGLAFGVLLLAQLVAAEVGVDLPLVLLSVVFYGLVFGGAHCYLALRDEGGLVPPSSRWRYLGFLAAVVGLGAVAAITGADRLVAGVELRAIALAVAGLLALVYLVVEARDGYRSTLEAGDDA